MINYIMREGGFYKGKIIAAEDILDEESSKRLEKIMLDESLLRGLDAHELEKTKEEIQIIADLNKAIANFLARLGLEPITVMSDSIHVLSPEEYRAKVTDSEITEASYMPGHIYVQRGDANTLAKHLSHEFAHAISYYAHTVYWCKRREKGFKLIPKMRIGYSMCYHDRGVVGFNGLNEAMTEMFASFVRREYAKITEKTDEEKKDIDEVAAYIPHVLLLMRIMRFLGEGADLQHQQEGNAKFFHGFITGDLTFLKKLEAKKKGAVKILMQMGPRVKDALSAAEALGFTDVIAEYEALKQ